MAVRHWRVLTWVILGVNGLFAWWLLAGIGLAVDAVSKACSDGAAGLGCDIGVRIGAVTFVGFVLFLWTFVVAILGITWLVTRRPETGCPACAQRTEAAA